MKLVRKKSVEGEESLGLVTKRIYILNLESNITKPGLLVHMRLTSNLFYLFIRLSVLHQIYKQDA